LQWALPPPILVTHHFHLESNPDVERVDPDSRLADIELMNLLLEKELAGADPDFEADTAVHSERESIM
jgi:hypothetical protein